MPTTQADHHVTYSRAFIAGMIGAIALAFLLWLGRISGATHFSMSLILGSLLLNQVTAAAIWCGFFLNLLVGGLFGMLYEWGFRKMHHAGILPGMFFGVFHWIAVGLFLGYLPKMDRVLPRLMNLPGSFALNFNLLEAVNLFIVHIVFGLIVGVICLRTSQNESVMTGGKPLHSAH